ncbi:MAG: zf-HC2 domain-containing protein [Chloracidobacterium sp.]|nr:zf-HC2 domain-containing protein [Chloracidobacterium sp.]
MLSAFLDNELDESQAGLVREHLAVCNDCAVVCEDLSAILFTCTAETSDDIMPSNAKAMWCRISNTIESEIKPPTATQPEPPKGRFLASLAAATSVSRAWDRDHKFAFDGGRHSQLLTAVGRRFYDPLGRYDVNI